MYFDAEAEYDRMRKEIQALRDAERYCKKPRIIRVCFELTMPNRGSWNGQWSQQGEGHYIFKEFSPADFEKNKDRLIGSWHYSWSDGWGACITSEVIDGNESRRRKRANRGFCGYGWMVSSILLVGEILNSSDLKEKLLQRKSPAGCTQTGDGSESKHGYHIAVEPDGQQKFIFEGVNK